MAGWLFPCLLPLCPRPGSQLNSSGQGGRSQMDSAHLTSSEADLDHKTPLGRVLGTCVRLLNAGGQELVTCELLTTVRKKIPRMENKFGLDGKQILIRFFTILHPHTSTQPRSRTNLCSIGTGTRVPWEHSLPRSWSAQPPRAGWV
uniref:Uncharacterized protein n=1 Tax=Molossus molossus TaxID=27622 RepID=A0A7J8BN43_MOLMO|nr:hypothetical protein HJG59_010115 [Molossus molossus]